MNLFRYLLNNFNQLVFLPYNALKIYKGITNGVMFFFKKWVLTLNWLIMKTKLHIKEKAIPNYIRLLLSVLINHYFQCWSVVLISVLFC